MKIIIIIYKIKKALTQVNQDVYSAVHVSKIICDNEQQKNSFITEHDVHIVNINTDKESRYK